MLGIAKNYDVLCYHLKVVHKNLGNPLKKQIDSFLEGLKSDLVGKEFLHDAIEEKFPLILNLRLAALKWIATEGQNLTELLDNEAYPYFERIAEVESLSNLSENILFALRCNKKVIIALLNNIEQEEFPSKDFLKIPEISFDQFIASVYLSAPNDESAKTMIEWVKCSFRIEYCICAAAIIYDEKLKLPQQKIEELSIIIIEAAQTYSAIAVELGILPSKKITKHSVDPAENSGFLEEQKILAETGIDLFVQNWKA